MMDIHARQGFFYPFHACIDGIFDFCFCIGVAYLVFFHYGIYFWRVLFFINEGLIGININLRDRIIFLFGFIKLEILKSPDNHCDLTPHIINIILRLHVISGALEDPGKGIAYYGIPDVTDMQRAVRICRCVLQDYFPLFVQVPEILPVMKHGKDGFIQEGAAYEKVDIRSELADSVKARSSASNPAFSTALDNIDETSSLNLRNIKSMITHKLST